MVLGKHGVSHSLSIGGDVQAAAKGCDGAAREVTASEALDGGSGLALAVALTLRRPGFLFGRTGASNAHGLRGVVHGMGGARMSCEEWVDAAAPNTKVRL